ncbi:TLC ATP/ADP transporter [Nitzschia inconspicua]|uniref:ADP,ATP carrier protein n=1 Tax=Nitzschia inconspicua TaxID=303405 RepID=A0A9K3LIK1_9STRA|nr:TLC ATP/ADP transporter [Nitzschia inconspicua]
MCMPPLPTDSVTSTSTTTTSRVATGRASDCTGRSRNKTIPFKRPADVLGYSRSSAGTDTDINDKNQNSSRSFARIQSILFMASASALHFAGFEFARSGTIALFTSSKTGFASASASPLSTICMTPFSILVLWLYTKSLERWEPWKCLNISSVLFAFLLASSAGILRTLEMLMDHSTDCDEGRGVQVLRRLAQTTIFSLNVAQSSFVQLLYTQHWSFIGSVSKEWEGATVWFAPIAGLGSIASTLAALGVQPVIQRWGLTGSLGISSIFLLASGCAADVAYRIANRHCFEPTRKEDTGNHYSKRQDLHSHSASLVETSLRLFSRVPILVNLCIEVLTCQSVSSIINFLFLLKVRECIPNDQQRASWTATWYARINFFSGVLQFGVLPLLMKHWKSKSDNNRNSNQQHKVWLVMPMFMMASATLMSYQTEHLSLLLVTVSFALYKTLEYSVRCVAVEMVYVNLDYESRFFGKEVIGLLVDRLGKSSTAVVLSLVPYYFGDTESLDKAFVQALSVGSLVWLAASYPLANPKRKDKMQ